MPTCIESCSTGERSTGTSCGTGRCEQRVRACLLKNLCSLVGKLEHGVKVVGLGHTHGGDQVLQRLSMLVLRMLPIMGVPVATTYKTRGCHAPPAVLLASSSLALALAEGDAYLELGDIRIVLDRSVLVRLSDGLPDACGTRERQAGRLMLHLAGGWWVHAAGTQRAVSAQRNMRRYTCLSSNAMRKERARRAPQL